MTGRTRCRQRGSLLLELGLTLLILGALAVASFALFGDADRVRKEQAARAVLASTEAAIKAFVLREKRLPCPDPLGNGLEGGGACSPLIDVGFVPFLALGIEEPRIDGNRRLRYGVWRGPLSDLVQPNAIGIPRLSDLDGSRTFLQTAVNAAAVTGLDTTKAYVPQEVAGTRMPDCGQVRSNPAFVLAPEAAPGSTPNRCFGVVPDSSGMAMGVERSELVGWWLQSTGMRGGAQAALVQPVDGGAPNAALPEVKDGKGSAGPAPSADPNLLAALGTAGLADGQANPQAAQARADADARARDLARREQEIRASGDRDLIAALDGQAADRPVAKDPQSPVMPACLNEDASGLPPEERCRRGNP